ncbi:MAG: hypothetical protein MN733_21995 [Nitrososphaera sp.]|nr:hypothetical protein [Nitrososphaera sp.]
MEEKERQKGLTVKELNGGRALTPIHPEEYFDAVGHRLDAEGAICRPVKNNSAKDFERALSPDAVYRNVVRHYAVKSGVATETRVSPHVERTTSLLFTYYSVLFFYSSTTLSQLYSLLW